MAEKLWVEQFIKEIEKEDREKILEEAIAEEGLTEENALRRQFFEDRYEFNPKSKLMVDHLIRGWMSMAYLANESKSLFGKSRVEKEKKKIRADLALDVIQKYGKLGEEIMYGEYYNAACLYMKLCDEDKTYGAILLGLGRMKPAKLIEKIAADIYRVAYELPEEVGMKEEMAVFSRALTDAFCDVHRKERNLLLGRIPGRRTES
ncbi:MAG: hypothetical protein K5852_01365 [Eubacterium sp.]|nr:hypothetical protein [Eubacterium sp.]